MRRTQRLIAAAVLLSLTSALAGCGGGWGSDFDPSDLFNFLDTKKKLPGTREPVFPGGVPGMEQGVPKELYKSAVEQQERQDEAAAAAAAAPPATPPQAGAEAGQAKEGARPGAQSASNEQPGAGQEGAAPHREHKRKVVRKRKPKPATQSAQTEAQPAQAPASAQPVQSAQPAQPSPPPFPAPLPSGSFSHQ